MENNNSTSHLASITEAAKINNVTRQAIYVAIKQGKLKAHKDETTTRWMIDSRELQKYRDEKYSRKKSMFNGELVFDNGKGFYSVNQTAEVLGVPSQKIYYATRVGHLKATRKGAAWVVHTNDLNEYKKSYLGQGQETGSQA